VADGAPTKRADGHAVSAGMKTSGAGGRSKGVVWAHRIVMASPAFDDDLCLLQRIEDFPVQQLVSEKLSM
jgi:hypothetical protein